MKTTRCFIATAAVFAHTAVKLIETFPKAGKPSSKTTNKDRDKRNKPQI